MTRSSLPQYHSAVWDEPVVMELGRPGRRAFLAPQVEPGVRALLGADTDLVPAGARRADRPALPELSEFEVQRHYLHLAQMTLGMMGINLFGTCTMKYNPRIGEDITAEPRLLAEVHPHQDDSTLQGVLEIVHEMDLILRELSGMDRFTFQAGGGASAAYTHACVTRAYHASRGELDQRDEIITTIQTHPSAAATSDAAGFKVVSLALDDDGYPSVESLQAAVSDRTAALMINNPDDMGIYNPNMRRWVEIVHEAGALAFWDSANFNGVMGRIRARELGFDACMYMLHKTFGAPKAGGGPAVGAYGCTEELAPFLPRPLVVREEDGYRLDHDGPQSLGRVREFWGNIPQVVKAYAWSRALGAEGITQAASLSVLANNYMEKPLLAIPGVTRSNPGVTMPRLEMTRYSLEQVTRDTGITVFDIQHRMVDFGVDAFWLSHEPWLVPQPFTPEAGELWSREDLDTWVAVLAQVVHEAYDDPELVRTAPHNQAIHKVDASRVDDPDYWATTWRAYQRKRGLAAEMLGV